MAGYNDTRNLIIEALMGRQAGTEIQPEKHQAYALNMLDYVRSVELVSSSTLVGLAEESTVPIQPDQGKVCYIAGVGQDRTVTFSNFIDDEGNPISITTGEMEGVFVILLWNMEHWVAYTFNTNIISSAESANFYYGYNIRKTYASVAAMNADSVNPIGTDGRLIKIGELVTVVNSTTPAENGYYGYEGSENGWLLQSGFSFEIVQTTGTDINKTMSQKAVTDELALKVDKTTTLFIRTKNLFDKSKPLLDGYYTQSGVWKSSATYHSTDEIDISGCDYIFIQCSQNSAAKILVYFDSIGNKIKPLESSSSNYNVDNWGLHQTPQGAISVSVLAVYGGYDSIDDLMVEKAEPGQTEGSPYEGYGFASYVKNKTLDAAIQQQNDNLYEENNLVVSNQSNIVNGAYVANGTGVVTPIAKNVSYIKIPLTTSKTKIFFLVKELPYTNVSHFGVFTDINDDYISNVVEVNSKYADTMQIIYLPAGAAFIYLNFQTGYEDRFSLFFDIESPLLHVKKELLNLLDLKKITNAPLFINTVYYQLRGYFTVDGGWHPGFGYMLRNTIPYECKEGDVFKVENYSTVDLTPGSLARKITKWDENMNWIGYDSPVTDPFEYTVPAGEGVKYLTFLFASAAAATMSVKKISSPNSEVKILRSSIFPEIPEPEAGESNVWEDVAWASLGDSLTFRNQWQPYVVDVLKLIHTNCGIGSTRLAGLDANAFWQDVRLNAVKAANPSVLTILGGANDITNDIPIGTDAEFDLALASKDKTNFKGAYSYIIENLLTWKPSLKIIVLTTSFAHSGGASYSPSGNMRYYMYADASREVANHYGLPVVDLYRDMNLNKLTQSIYTSDSIHWNDAGAKIVASLVIAKLREIRSV